MEELLEKLKAMELPGRWAVFAWDWYYPGGPESDFLGAFETRESAERASILARGRWDYVGIFDLLKTLTTGELEAE